MKEELILKLRKQRVELDKLLKLIKEEIPIAAKEQYVREVSLAYTALQKGRMYLGEMQHDLGAKYPYEGTNDAKDVIGIAMAVDMFESPVSSLQGNNIENLGTLRKSIDKVVKELEEVIAAISDSKLIKIGINKFIQDCNISEGYRSIKEGRMWLGCAMGVIKDISEKKK